MYIRLDRKEGETDLYSLARQKDRDVKDLHQAWVIKDRDGNVLIGDRSMMGKWEESLKSW